MRAAGRLVRHSHPRRAGLADITTGLPRHRHDEAEGGRGKKELPHVIFSLLSLLISKMQLQKRFLP